MPKSRTSTPLGRGRQEDEKVAHRRSSTTSNGSVVSNTAKPSPIRYFMFVVTNPNNSFQLFFQYYDLVNLTDLRRIIEQSIIAQKVISHFFQLSQSMLFIKIQAKRMILMFNFYYTGTTIVVN